jgi:hypothetical protein
MRFAGGVDRSVSLDPVAKPVSRTAPRRAGQQPAQLRVQPVDVALPGDIVYRSCRRRPSQAIDGLYAEAKGRTAAIGLDVDTLYGQLLRRMPADQLVRQLVVPGFPPASARLTPTH